VSSDNLEILKEMQHFWFEVNKLGGVISPEGGSISISGISHSFNSTEVVAVLSRTKTGENSSSEKDFHLWI